MKISGICDHIIEYSFYLLFFLVPLVLTPLNYELFEYNKMMLTYGLTIIIVGAWLIKMILQRRILFLRTPLDIPILIFFVSQLLSFFFSLDRHVSLWGYYSRFNGGLISTLCYLLLYYALLNNINRQQIIKLLKISLLSALTVSLYGILEHFGIDKNIWVQDVQNRVFSTLGQPNWLAAYLAVLIPIGIGFIFPVIASKAKSPQMRDPAEAGQSRHAEFNSASVSKRILKQVQNDGNIEIAAPFGLAMTLKKIAFYLILSTFYLCLLYTKSRSGLLGFGAGLGTFFVISFLFSVIRKKSTGYLFTSFKPIDRRLTNQNPRTENREQITSLASQEQVLQNFRPFFILTALYFLLSVLVGTPWTPSVLDLIRHPLNTKYQILNTVPKAPALETGGTESGEIRKIVWRGAIDIAKHYPLFGSGVETFAYSYYQFRPISHNLTSEWDFLYNKAHNEYLNYAATTGFVGLGAYLLLIGWFLIWSLKNVFVIASSRHAEIFSASISNKKRILNQVQNDGNDEIAAPFGLAMTFALLASYASILVTNFFGFSVVIIALYFWLIPGMVISIVIPAQAGIRDTHEKPGSPVKPGMTGIQFFAFSLILLSTLYFLLYTIRFWYADTLFNRAYQLNKAGYYKQAYEPFHQAIDLNPNEPFYKDELSSTAAVLAAAAFEQKEATLAAQLTKDALYQGKMALSISPQNVTFWKTRTRVFYLLATIDDKYNQDALDALLVAHGLAPNDPKIAYNLGLLYGRVNDQKMAIKTLEEAVKLKPDYRDSRFALALYYKEANQPQKALDQLNFILQKISTDDAQAKGKLKEWSTPNP